MTDCTKTSKGNSESTEAEHVSPATPYRLGVMTPPADLDAAAVVCRQALGMNAIDAKTRLRHVPAVWPDDFSEHAAQEAAHRLHSLGMQVAAVPALSVPDLHTARLLHHVQCKGEGFVVVSVAGEPEQVIDWSRLALLSVADVSGLHQESGGNVPDGVFRHAPGITQSTPATNDHGLELWLLSDSPLQAFRMDAELMNYEYLGVRRTLSTEENFAHLMDDIQRNAPRLMLTPDAEAYLNAPTGILPRIASPAAHRDAVAAHWVMQHATSKEE